MITPLLLPLLLLSTASALEDKCPKTKIAPCTCKTYFDGACIVTCSLASEEDLRRLADIPNLCQGHVHFVLVHSKLTGIPAKLWKVLLSSETVDISIRHTAVEGLVPPGGEDIPEVHTAGKAIIKVDHSKVAAWDWKQLQNFRSEEELVLIIDDTPLPDLSKEFSQIAQGLVHKLTIDSAGLTSVPDRMFAGFEDLSSLSLQNNKLTSIARSVMPRPAKQLKFLHLTGNQLTSIPSDLFSDMPELELVYLRDNQIKTLPEGLFQNLPPGISRIDFFRNPWDCTCELKKVLQSTNQVMKLGLCETPASLKGKSVANLPKLLDC